MIIRARRLSMTKVASRRSAIYHSKIGSVPVKAEKKKIKRLAKLTIAVDCAVGTWLFSITLDFLASTFIACAGYTPPLLQRLWLRSLVVGNVIAR